MNTANQLESYREELIIDKQLEEIREIRRQNRNAGKLLKRLFRKDSIELVL